MTPTLIEQVRAELQAALHARPVISSWSRLLDYCQVTYQEPVEVFHVLFLDRKNRLIDDHCLGRGTVDHVPVYPREILRMAILKQSSAVILVHNHPSGDPTPSESDIEMTNRIIEGGNALGVTVHDHIIVGAGTEISFRAEGLIQ